MILRILNFLNRRSWWKKLPEGLQFLIILALLVSPIVLFWIFLSETRTQMWIFIGLAVMQLALAFLGWSAVRDGQSWGNLFRETVSKSGILNVVLYFFLYSCTWSVPVLLYTVYIIG